MNRFEYATWGRVFFRKRWKKSLFSCGWGLNKQNNKFYRCSTLFGVFLCCTTMTWNFLNMRRSLEGVNAPRRIFFFFQTVWVRCPRNSTPETMNKFEKKNIHFNSDVFAALAVRPIFINVTLPFGFYANSCDPRRKSIGFVVRIVYTTKHCEFKANRIQNLRRIDQTGTLLFRIYASARKRQNVLCGKHMTGKYFKRLVLVSSLGVTFMELMKTGRFLTGSFVFSNQVHHFPYIKIHAGCRGLGE